MLKANISAVLVLRANEWYDSGHIHTHHNTDLGTSPRSTGSLDNCEVVICNCTSEIQWRNKQHLHRWYTGHCWRSPWLRCLLLGKCSRSDRQRCDGFSADNAIRKNFCSELFSNMDLPFFPLLSPYSCVFLGAVWHVEGYRRVEPCEYRICPPPAWVREWKKIQHNREIHIYQCIYLCLEHPPYFLTCSSCSVKSNYCIITVWLLFVSTSTMFIYLLHANTVPLDRSVTKFETGFWREMLRALTYPLCHLLLRVLLEVAPTRSERDLMWWMCISILTWYTRGVIWLKIGCLWR